MNGKYFSLLCMLFLTSCTSREAVPPAPYGATPSEAQLQWHETDFYGMICISTITYTDQEWGYGDEPAELFNPEQFDAREMVAVMKEAGMKGVLLVAKHHGGFCLWPTATTDYSVKNSPWHDGKGDMVREFADAAREAGLKFGVYNSPWDRNDADYGKPEYLQRYREQLRELHTDYGDIFISWYDGANGGDGYYGGAREMRKLDLANYYDWDNTLAMVREWQPLAAHFNFNDIRWIGNESGYANDPCWATVEPDAWWSTPGTGKRNGKKWMPAECDVPIRPGWFYHASQDDRVKTPEQLFDLYFLSVGLGQALDIGLAPDKSGRLHPNDVKSLKGLGELLKQTFAANMAADASVKVNGTRDGNRAFSAGRLTDGDRTTYWCTDDDAIEGEITLEWKQPRQFNIISLREYLPLGQRIDSISIEIFTDGQWIPFAKAASIGANRLLRKTPVEASKIHIHTYGPVCPALSEIGVYLEPKRINTPVISRNRQGVVSVDNLNPFMSACYTLDGTEPERSSAIYSQPLPLPDGGLFKLKVFDGEKGGETVVREFGMAKAQWKTIPESSDIRAFDENPSTVWHAADKQELCIDMGSSVSASAFVYTPPTDKAAGLAGKYELYVVDKPGQWGKAVAVGEFGNIQNNPLPQTVRFETPVYGRYLRFVATGTIEDAPVAVAEIDVLK